MERYNFVLVLLIMMVVFWLVLNESFQFHDVGVGFVIGILTLFLVQIYVLDSDGKDFNFYLLLVVLKVFAKTVIDILPSAWLVIKSIIMNRMNISRITVALPTKYGFLNALLCNFVTLTPGSITLEKNVHTAEMMVLNPDNLPEDKLVDYIESGWRDFYQ